MTSFVFVLQTFFYNVNMLPSELFDESVSLRVSRHRSSLLKKDPAPTVFL